MKAIVISGFEYPKKKKKNGMRPENLTPEFIEDTKRFVRYLILKARLKIDDVFVFKPSKIKTIRLWGLCECVRQISNLYATEPLVIYYSGHGEKKYWNLRHRGKKGDPSYFLKHRRLFNILRKRSAPLIVIADCCYGMAIGKYLKKLNYPWLLLGLAPENRVGFGSVERQIEMFWSHGFRAFPKYDIGEEIVETIKFKSFNKKLYGLKYLGRRRFRKFYFSYSYKTVKIILRAGHDLDYLLFPKK